MSSMGKQFATRFLSVDGCDQKQRLGRRSWTFRQSGVLCAKDATSVGTGRGVVIPPEEGGVTGRHDKRHHSLQSMVTGHEQAAEKLLPGHEVGYLGTLPRLGRSELQNLWYSTLSAPLARDRHCPLDGAYHTLQG